jgi:[acyl-carrier-protein] S-malonyltransferase
MSDIDITDTSVAQPLIVAASLASAAALGPLPANTVFAGHSVGEFAACALAGLLHPDTAMRLIAVRGRAMAAASVTPASGMAAVLGGDEPAVLAGIERSGCVAANYNGAGQIVAAGSTTAVERLIADPPDGSRVRPLAVAGAFHTELMAPARVALAEEAEWVTATDSPTGVLSNRDGTLVTSGEEMLTRLISQVCQPVRWDACTRTLESMGVTAVIELAPAGTLTAMLKRALPGVRSVALRSPDDLEAAQHLIAEHGIAGEHGDELTGAVPGWRLLVAPAGGTVRIPQARHTTALAAGDVVAHVATRTEDLAVTVKEPGRLIELLVHDGDPVSSGQPVARISRERS